MMLLAAEKVTKTCPVCKEFTVAASIADPLPFVVISVNFETKYTICKRCGKTFVAENI